MADPLIEAVLSVGRGVMSDLRELRDAQKFSTRQKTTLVITTIKVIQCRRCNFQKVLSTRDAEPTLCPACGGTGSYEWSEKRT